MDLALEAPFVLDTDSDKIARYNARARDEHQVRKDAWPFPFMGNPEAPIVLLNLNPGYKANDVLWQDNDALKHAYRANLRHDEAEYPFTLLDPQFRGHPGNDWWRAKLRELIDAFGPKTVAQNVLVLEWFPYPSIKYGRPPRLFSQNYTFELARRAARRGATLIVIRARSPWEDSVDELRDVRLHVLNSPISGAVSARNCPTGFPEALRRL